MTRGDQIDWAAPTPHADDPVATYLENPRSLRAALAEHPDSQPGADEQRPEVAERDRALRQASPTDDNRSPAFGPERQAPAPTPGSTCGFDGVTGEG